MGAVFRTFIGAVLLAQLTAANSTLAAPFVAPSASAGTLFTCTQADPQPAALRACVEDQRRRAANQLRETSQSTLVAVNQQTRSEGRRSALRTFRQSQSRHVRWRQSQCHREADDVARSACEADADFAQVARLQQLAGAH
ncbi:MAG: hypothetical protein M3N23_09510 [Pseudomonadota bacterium]|nr:hypothetical protein [Pseudomonadota bacterium]